MSLVKFTLEPNVIYEATLKPNGNLFEITFANQASMPNQNVLLGGFSNINEFNGEIMTTWTGYSTLYRTYPDKPTTFVLSNNGSVYVEPTRDVIIRISWNDENNRDRLRPTSVSVKATPTVGKAKNITLNDDNNWAYTISDVPVSINYILTVTEIPYYEISINGTSITCSHTHITTIEEARSKKITEMHVTTTSTIESGCDVELTNGNIEHFRFTDSVQKNVTTAYNTATALINGGHTEMEVPFYDSSDRCKMYSSIDIVKIYLAMGGFITYCVTLDHQLESQINTMTLVSAVEAVEYDVEYLDEEHRETFDEIIEQGQAIIDVLLGN